MKNTILLCSAFFLFHFLFAQAPQAISYQAVVRDVSGSLLINQNISLRMSIHDTTATGTIVYQETQISTTNSLGLATVNIGMGISNIGSFSEIKWGNGNKFLQVEFDPNGGNIYTDMGTSQMLSVPYALHAGNISVSSIGDTLFFSPGNWVIIPNISSANRCSASVTDIDGNVYGTVKIGNLCWFKKNLNTTRYRNGDIIPTGLNDSAWLNTTAGAYSIYGNASVYGKLYNWYAVEDPRDLCPSGWHAANGSDWVNLALSVGGTEIFGGGQWQPAGALKEAGYAHWFLPNEGATNISNFSALPAGFRYNTGANGFIGQLTRFWAYPHNVDNAFFFSLDYNTPALTRSIDDKNYGCSVRCVGD